MNKFVSNIEYLRKYVKGELSASEMYEVEKAMHNDEMLYDIILGLQIEEKNDFKNNYPTVKEQINNLVNKPQNTKNYTIHRFLIAASILIIFGFGYFLLNQSNVKEITELPITSVEKINPQEPKRNETVIIQLDSSSFNKIEKNSTKSLKEHNDIVNKKQEYQKENLIANLEVQKKITLNNPPIFSTNIPELKEIEIVPNNIIKLNNVTRLENVDSSIRKFAITNSNPTSIADIQRLNINQDAKNTLYNLLNRQQLEKNSNENLVAIKPGISIELKDSTFKNALALNDKNISKSIQNNLLNIQNNYLPIKTIVVKNDSLNLRESLSKSTPVKGWNKYIADFKRELAKENFLHYNLLIKIKIDTKGLPKLISIEGMHTPEMEKSIVQILKSNGHWNIGENKNIIEFLLNEQ